MKMLLSFLVVFWGLYGAPIAATAQDRLPSLAVESTPTGQTEFGTDQTPPLTDTGSDSNDETAELHALEMLIQEYTGGSPAVPAVSCYDYGCTTDLFCFLKGCAGLCYDNHCRAV